MGIIIMYCILLILQVTLLVFIVLQKNKKSWMILLCIECISILIALGVGVYYNIFGGPNFEGFFEVLVSFGMVIVYSLLLGVSVFIKRKLWSWACVVDKERARKSVMNNIENVIYFPSDNNTIDIVLLNKVNNVYPLHTHAEHYTMGIVVDGEIVIYTSPLSRNYFMSFQLMFVDVVKNTFIWCNPN